LEAQEILEGDFDASMVNRQPFIFLGRYRIVPVYTSKYNNFTASVHKCLLCHPKAERMEKNGKGDRPGIKQRGAKNGGKPSTGRS
jgi:hypothetical protein